MAGAPVGRPVAVRDRGAGSARPAATPERSRRPRRPPARCSTGLPAAPGLAAGPALLAAPCRAGASAGSGGRPGRPSGRRCERALAATATEIRRAQAGLAGRAGDGDAAIFDAHLLFLDDEALLEPAREAVFARGEPAARAWAEAVAAAAARWDTLEDAYQRARAADLRAVGDQVLANLAAGVGGGKQGRGGGEATRAPTPRTRPSRPVA